MNNFDWFLQGLAEGRHAESNLLYAVIGVLLRTARGRVLPGIGPAMTVALLLPVTYNVSPSAAFIMFAGIFYGGMYGGSTTSILLNTPGESSLSHHGHRGRHDGQGRSRRPGTGDSGDRIVRVGCSWQGWCCLRHYAPPISRFAVTLGAPSISRSCCSPWSR